MFNGAEAHVIQNLTVLAVVLVSHCQTCDGLFIMKFNEQLATILEARGLRPAVITMKRGTVIEADHVRMVKTKTGRTILVVGIGPGRYEKVHRYNNPGGIVNKLRDFYGPHRYAPTPQQDQATGADLEGTCENCQRHYLECMKDPCEHPSYYYDLHRILITYPLFKRIITIRPENIESIREIR